MKMTADATTLNDIRFKRTIEGYDGPSMLKALEYLRIEYAGFRCTYNASGGIPQFIMMVPSQARKPKGDWDRVYVPVVLWINRQIAGSMAYFTLWRSDTNIAETIHGIGDYAGLAYPFDKLKWPGYISIVRYNAKRLLEGGYIWGVPGMMQILQPMTSAINIPVPKFT